MRPTKLPISTWRTSSLSSVKYDVLARLSLHQIADALNARGITTLRGGRWFASSVRNVLERA